jgi:hypothetical protein
MCRGCQGIEIMSKKSNVPAKLAQLGLPADTAALTNYLSSGSDHVGDLLKLSGKTGDLTYGSQGTELAAGTRLAVLLGQARVGFIRWRDGKPEKQAWRRLIDDPDLKALRQTLDELDPNEWEELTPSGAPKDPYRESVMVPMVRMKDGHLFTFSSSSEGAARAVKQLAKYCLIHQRAVPAAMADHVPIVEIHVGHYQHSSRQVGQIFFPILDVVDWVPPGQVLHALATAGNAAAFGVPNAEALNADLGPEPEADEPEAGEPATEPAAQEPASAPAAGKRVKGRRFG